jgi:Arc/MetJ-type ribon-helix-helix transcriptional regulator
VKVFVAAYDLAIMARGITIDVSLTAKEFKLVRDQVVQGGFSSESEVIREGLRQTFSRDGAATASSKRRTSDQQLAAAYRAMAVYDRKLAREWSTLNDPWPNS